MQTEPEKMNVLSLAYLGDSVWELFVRERTIASLANASRPDRLHKEGVKYVNAFAQAKAIHSLMDENILTEKELALVKRARNHRTASKAKNADAVTYKWATAFEALIGFLYLSDKNRMWEIVIKSIEVIKTETYK